MPHPKMSRARRRSTTVCQHQSTQEVDELAQAVRHRALEADGRLAGYVKGVKVIATAARSWFDRLGGCDQPPQRGELSHRQVKAPMGCARGLTDQAGQQSVSV